MKTLFKFLSSLAILSLLTGTAMAASHPSIKHYHYNPSPRSADAPVTGDAFFLSLGGGMAMDMASSNYRAFSEQIPGVTERTVTQHANRFGGMSGLFRAAYGYGWTLGKNYYLGVEVEWQSNHENNKVNFTYKSQNKQGGSISDNRDATLSYKLKDVFGADLVLGRYFGQNAMFYLKGGITHADVHYGYNDQEEDISPDHPFVQSKNKDAFGYEVGFGGRYALSRHFSFYTEYDLDLYSKDTIAGRFETPARFIYTDTKLSVRPVSSQILAGVIYNF